MNAAAMEVRARARCLAQRAAAPHTRFSGADRVFSLRARRCQTLPIFLDKLVNPVGAILISVTMVLIFGAASGCTLRARCRPFRVLGPWARVSGDWRPSPPLARTALRRCPRSHGRRRRR
jgi:hypothetical protein